MNTLDLQTSSYTLTCTCDSCLAHSARLTEYYKNMGAVKQLAQMPLEQLAQPAPSTTEDIRVRELSDRIDQGQYCIMAMLYDMRGNLVGSCLLCTFNNGYIIYSRCSDAEQVATDLTAERIVHNTLRELFKRKLLETMTVKYKVVLAPRN